MADTKMLLQILAVGFLFALIATVDAGVSDLDLAGMGWISGGSGCKGTVGDCLNSGEEFEMDSDIHRRILANSGYIGYGAMNRNRVPCSRRGASYYNCQPGAEANPYHRGCSAITRCARE